MLLVEGAGLPLAIAIGSARPAQVTLIEPLLDEAVTPFGQDRLIYDRAAGSDPLRERLAARNIELICSHHRGRKRPASRDDPQRAPAGVRLRKACSQLILRSTIHRLLTTAD
jgi:hypothetical protein